tara:strand:- start:106 stop:1173 length:1068 start_codon:yes stop_codon:yes gene_type:complete
MIGKNNSFDSTLLTALISVVILINSIYFNNVYIFLLFVISILLSNFCTKFGLKYLKQNNFFQSIRIEGPISHFKKARTPTMGGVFIIPLFLLVVLILDFPLLGIKINFLITIFGFFLIGIMDDYLSIKNKKNLGLKVKEKLILQVFVTSIFIFYQNDYAPLNTNINLVDGLRINIEEFIIPLSIFTIIALSNSLNLTDGLDGLASGCSSIVFCGLGTEILLNNENYIFSLLSFCMSGLCLGFLRFNRYPAKIFMGDAGSLSIGAIIGIICVVTNSFFTTLIISGIFVVESLSVLFQVSYFKITKRFYKKGKRLFLMTPLHHHFELKGIKEKKLVENFWIINIFLVIFSIVLKITI